MPSVIDVRALRRRPLYPTELRGLIQKIFNFQAQPDSNELPLRRGALYPAELLTQVSNTEKEYAVGRRCRLVKGRMAFSC